MGSHTEIASKRLRDLNLDPEDDFEVRSLITSLALGYQLDILILRQNVAGSENEKVQLQNEIVSLREKEGIDPKTGLLMLPAFKKRFQKFLASEKRSILCSLLFADAADLKAINSSHGHLVGDRLIIDLAKIFSKNIRSEGGVECRYGGDEFVALLTHMQSVSNVGDIFQRLRTAIKEYDWSYLEVLPRLDIGAVCFRVSEHNLSDRKQYADELLELFVDRADKLMYADKEKNKVAKIGQEPQVFVVEVKIERNKLIDQLSIEGGQVRRASVASASNDLVRP